MKQGYRLGRHLDSAAAPQIAADLTALQGQALQVDATDVEFSGALSLQVLVAARLQWAEDEYPFEVAPVSAALAKAAEGLGLDLSKIGAVQADIVESEPAT